MFFSLLTRSGNIILYGDINKASSLYWKYAKSLGKIFW